MKKEMNRTWKKAARIGICSALAGAMVFGGLAGTGSLTARETVAAENKGPLDVSDIVEEAMPSVVAITTKTLQEVQNYYNYGFPFFGFGFDYGYGNGYNNEPITREVQGAGSGIIVGKNDTELLIATNYHVVESADTISAGFIDSEIYEGKVKGYDEDLDVAIVAIPLDDLSDDTLKAISVAKLGSSDDLRVGEQIVVVGNAMGYGQSVTTGIVSAKNPRLTTDYGTETEVSESADLIQTDAAINPGNSGGAMLNMDGEVIGIASAKLADTLIEGMCYGIAVDSVIDTLTEIANEETREKLEDQAHGILGITGTTVSESEAQRYGFPQGVYVVEVTEGGPADEAGIEAGDIITKFNKKKISTIQELIERLSYYEPGEEVDLVVSYGRYNEEETVTVTLGEQEVSEEEEAEEPAEESDKSERRFRKSRDEEEAQDEEATAPEEGTEEEETAAKDEEDSTETEDNRSREEAIGDLGDGFFGNNK